jgi:DNA polymerase-3 subunit beta
MVATDGHRLAYAAEVLADAPVPIEVILPRKTVLELSRHLPTATTRWKSP